MQLKSFNICAEKESTGSHLPDGGVKAQRKEVRLPLCRLQPSLSDLSAGLRVAAGVAHPESPEHCPHRWGKFHCLKLFS